MDTSNNPIKLDYQGPVSVDGNFFGLSPKSGMPKRHPAGKDSDVAQRLRALMLAEGLGKQVNLANKLGVDKTRLNNALVGYPLSIDLALKMRKMFPGLTTDWLYEGAEEGLSAAMRDKLRDALARLRTGAA